MLKLLTVTLSRPVSGLIRHKLAFPCCNVYTQSVVTQRRCMSSDSTIELKRRFYPRRALLYVPGNDERKLKKIPELNVDCAVLDCEDGVAINRKEEARTTIAKMLDEIPFGRTEPVVRINSVRSGLAEDDLKAIFQAKLLPPTLMLPKVEKITDIEWLAEKLVSTRTEIKEKKSDKKDKREKKIDFNINVIIFIESAIGLLNFEAICRRAVELMELGVPISLDGVVFGSDDFCANIGAERTKDAKEVIYARQKIVLVAKAFQLQAIDMVHIDYHDLDGLREQSLEGARMGFTGKQVIHPSQISIVQECFSPSPSKVEWATELIKSFHEHQKSGEGAFTFRGSMIDMPSLRQAQNIVQLIDSLKAADQQI